MGIGAGRHVGRKRRSRGPRRDRNIRSCRRLVLGPDAGRLIMRDLCAGRPRRYRGWLGSRIVRLTAGARCLGRRGSLILVGPRADGIESIRSTMIGRDFRHAGTSLIQAGKNPGMHNPGSRSDASKEGKDLGPFYSAGLGCLRGQTYARPQNYAPGKERAVGFLEKALNRITTRRDLRLGRVRHLLGLFGESGLFQWASARIWPIRRGKECSRKVNSRFAANCLSSTPSDSIALAARAASAAPRNSR